MKAIGGDPFSGGPSGSGDDGLVALVCCDLGAIVRGRCLPAGDLDAHLAGGVGWVPANHALTPLGPLAEPNPFDSTGDLRLLPDAGSRARVAGALDMILCDIVETDGTPWQCCPRRFLRAALDDLADRHGLRLISSFEHELQLLPVAGAGEPATVADRLQASETGVDGETVGSAEPPCGTASARPETPPLPFSLDAIRRAEPFPRLALAALTSAGVQPERIFAEYAPHQFEIPVRPAEGVAAADRSVVLCEVVREVARLCGRHATFTPVLDPDHAGNGVHIHLSLLDADGLPALYDATRPARLSELGARFAAGILLHAGALTALTAPSPLSSIRLAPHHWSAGAVCLGQRNRETLLRLPPLVELGGGAELASQLRLEYRAADASANPYLALGAIVRAGMHGIEAGLPEPPILDRDPTTLGPAESSRYGVGALPASLEEALQTFAEDDVARGWLSPLLYDAYLAVRRADLRASAAWNLEQTCSRYARVY